MTAKIPAVLVTGSLGPGGTELAVIAHARGFARRGVVAPRVVVLGEGGEHAAALRDEGIPVEELAIPRGRLRSLAGLARLARLRRLVRSLGGPVVHTFLFDADVYGMLAALLGSPGAVITTRRAIKRNRPHHLRLYRLTNFLVDRIVCNSEEVRRFTLEAEAADPSRVEVIVNGIDVERFAAGDGAAARARLGIGPDETLVGAVGTIKEVKGQRVLLEAMVPLLRERPGLRLVLAGDRRGRYAEELARETREAGMEERVVMPGPVADVPDLLAALDLFVLPSLSEGMSNALLEAMASGCPIVATRVGGNAEALAEGRAGLLVPAGDPDALREAIVRLLDDPDLAAALAARAVVRARTHYSLEGMLETTEALYAGLLGWPRGRFS